MMGDPAGSAPSVLEWEPRIDVVGGDAANRVAPELESMEGGAAGEAGHSDDDFSAAATRAFEGMPAEEPAVRKKMAIGELASQRRKEGAANWVGRRRRIPSALRLRSKTMDLGTSWAQQGEKPIRRRRRLGIPTTR